MPTQIPVLDAKALLNGTPEERAAFGQKFLESMTENGFVKLVNHTVPLPEVEDTFSQVSSPPCHAAKIRENVG